MTKRVVLLSMALALALPAMTRAQGAVNFSGPWTLDKTNPPLPAGRGGGNAGGGGDEAFGAVTQTVVITQTGTELTVQAGPMKAVYKLDGNMTVTPAGDVNGLKTRAHWDGAKLHLHFKRGQNWCRDVLSVNGKTLTILRDLEAGGGSTTRTITYAKTS
jgi:hypothetical protein